MVDPDQNQPNNSISVSHSCSDGHCSEDETWPVVTGPVDQTGPMEANSTMNLQDESEMEALLSSGVGPDSGLTGIVSEGPAQVDDLLDMDWEGFASHLWDERTQNDLLRPAEEPQAPAAGSDSEELESFVSWLLSDAC